MRIALDFGISNTDAVLAALDGTILGSWTVPASTSTDASVLRTLITNQVNAISSLEEIVVTGGRSRQLPDMLEGRPVRFVDEIRAIARGGLALSGREEALVMSAGSGTALVAARGDEIQHVGGTAMGGGTLIGLSRLLFNATAPNEIDRLAQSGDPSVVDLGIGEIIGGTVGMIPVSATAVNFGRLARGSLRPPTADIAAGLVAMISQQIGILAAITARGLGLTDVVVIGHLTEMRAVVTQLLAVGALYGCDFIVPHDAGLAVAQGALIEADRTA